MKYRFVYVAAVALMASGLVLAQSSTTPSMQDTQSGSSIMTAPQTSGQTGAVPCESSKANTSQVPGSMSANQGAGRTPEAGLNRGEKGTTNYVDAEHVEIEQGRADAGR